MLSVKFCNTILTVGQRGKPQATYTSQHHDNGHHNNNNIIILLIFISIIILVGGGGGGGSATEYLDCTVRIIIDNGLMITDKDYSRSQVWLISVSQ